MFYVYIIKSESKDWYYVGHTSDLNKRLSRHNNGAVRSTRHNRPYKILYTESFGTREESIRREKQIKQQRKLKELIINNLDKGPIV